MVSLKVNGTTHTVDVDDDTPLLWAIRDNIGLTGTKFGCGVAQCGACTVFIDGQPLRACVTPVSAVGTSEITTIEGLAGKEADAVQAACEFFFKGLVFGLVRLVQHEIVYEPEIGPHHSQARVVYPVIDRVAVTIEGDDVTVFI